MEKNVTAPVYETDGIHAETRLRDAGFVMPGHHCHICYELFYTQEGSCRFLIDDSIYDLQAGDFILVPPRALHYTRFVCGPCRRTVILFRAEDVLRETWAALPNADLFFAQAAVFQVPQEHRERINRCLKRMEKDR